MRNPTNPAQRVLKRIMLEEQAFLTEGARVPQMYIYKDSLDSLADSHPQINLSSLPIRSIPQAARNIPIRPKLQNYQDSLDLLLDLANANSKANSTKGRQL
jgi:hypothetical protein